MTHATISSGLVSNPPPSTPFVPPSRTNWDILFQPMFDELLNPPPSVDFPAPEVIAPIDEVVAPEPAVSTDSPSSTTVDQDAPSPSNSQTTPETLPPLIPNDVEEDNHDIEVAHMCYDVIVDRLVVVVHPSKEGSDLKSLLIRLQDRGYKDFSRVCRSHGTWSVYQMDMKTDFSELVISGEEVFVSQRTVCGIPDNPNPRVQATEVFMGLKQAHARDVNDVAVNLIFLGPKISKVPEASLLTKSKYALIIQRNTGFDSCDPVDIPVDSSIALIAFADADHAGCQDIRRSTSGSMQFLGDRLVSWSSKRQKKRFCDI
ncbi:retrovirus-related pol polyprotein from transposon TNT 1-94 [Tanacetum coccineum]